MSCPVFRTHKSFFFKNEAPYPHKGWTVDAFQDYCRKEMLQAGFDLTRRISCVYSPLTGYVVFWQEPHSAWLN